MKFSLIICTYMRPESLLKLLKSIDKQTLDPIETIIVDGSENNETELMLKVNLFRNIRYFIVDKEGRGLTKQRNFGISKVNHSSEYISFLDDDTELEVDYFRVLEDTYIGDVNITGVGGVAVNENRWRLKEDKTVYNSKYYYSLNNYVYKEGLRNVMRNFLCLQSDKLPGIMPSFSNGRTSGYPLTGSIYNVDLLVGMSFSFKRTVFESISFSTYFEGYGLYEDADYSLRALKFGENVINTNLRLNHYHDSSGRPNKYIFGKMVLRNGWYVWRVKFPKPTMISRVKWNLIMLLLTIIRFSNVITTNRKQEAFTEAVGRFIGWWSLIFNKPKITR